MRTIGILVVLVIAQQSPVRDAPRGETTTARIHGRVIDDIGQPVNRAVVTALGVPPAGARTTVSDQQGRYAIEDLPVARVRLIATRPPYPRATYGQLLPGDAGPEVVLTAGRAFDATIVMPRGAIISGTVHDSRGRLVPNVSVNVTPIESESIGRGVIGGSATTDANGRFRAWGLTAGDYTASVVHPHVSTRVSKVTPIALRAGEDREVALRLPEDDMRLARVEVHVVPPEGNFIPATSVHLIDVASGAHAGNGQVTPNGTFTLAGVPRGRYRAVTRALRYSDTSGPSAGRPTTTYWGVAEFIIDGEDTVVTVRLAPAVPVSGRVVSTGTAHLEPNKIYIQLVDTGASFLGVGAPGAMPKPDGTFELPGVGPGTYHLSVSATTASPEVSIVSAISGGVDAFDAPLVVSSEGATDIVVTLSDRVTGMDGVVRDANNAPAPHAGLVVYSSDERFWFKQSRRVVIVRPDSDGKFAVSGLPPGTYEVAVVTSLPPAWQDAAFLKRLTSAATVMLREGERIERTFVVR